MTMTLTDVRSIVRSISDLDITDLSNALLDSYVKEGFQQIVALERRYPFYQQSYSLNSEVGTRAYTISAIGDIREIISVVQTGTAGQRLSLISYDEGEAIWLGNLDTNGEPNFYSFWDHQIHLWPKPGAIYAYTVRAYRNPVYTWLTNITEAIDADEWFHVLLTYFVLSRIYQRQEDPQMSAMYMQSFEQGVGLARKDIMKPSSARPLVLSGGRRHPTMTRWLQTLGRTL